jgi:hypothetical protein
MQFLFRERKSGILAIQINGGVAPSRRQCFFWQIDDSALPAPQAACVRLGEALPIVVDFLLMRCMRCMLVPFVIAAGSRRSNIVEPAPAVSIAIGRTKRKVRAIRPRLVHGTRERGTAEEPRAVHAQFGQGFRYGMRPVCVKQRGCGSAIGESEGVATCPRARAGS